jgi:hypothetical protein
MKIVGIYFFVFILAYFKDWNDKELGIVLTIVSLGVVIHFILKKIENIEEKINEINYKLDSSKQKSKKYLAFKNRNDDE